MSMSSLFTGMRPALVALAAALVGCATAGRPLPPPTSGDALPPVAAAFRTLVVHNGRRETSDWRLWRSADRIEREQLQDRTGEVWQRDGATLFHTVLFHDERRGIEFEPADLQMTGAGAVSWAQQAQVVDSAVLQRLRLTRSAWHRDMPVQDYAGTIDAVQWRVRLRTDLMLPVWIEQRAASRTLRIELLEAHPLAAAPWQPTASTGYGLLDFADLGDHERDPFVLRAQARLGLGHDHDAH